MVTRVDGGVPGVCTVHYSWPKFTKKKVKVEVDIINTIVIKRSVSAVTRTTAVIKHP